MGWPAVVCTLCCVLRVCMGARCGGVGVWVQVLGSTIGRYDGNVYEALYEGATKSRLNLSQPFQGYKEHLQPHLDIGLLKLKGGLLPEAKL